MKGKGMRRHVPVALLLALAATVSGVAGAAGAAQAGTTKVKHAHTKAEHASAKAKVASLKAASASTIVPYPKALANHPFAEQWTPKQLASSPWNSPANAPGNCPANPSQISLNSSGYAEIKTNGKVGNCASIESSHEYPTKDGYVYEADVYFSTWENWPAFWMYGNDWPQAGEIDAVEANLDDNYVTWHYGTNNSTIGTGSWNDKVVTPTSANISPGWHIIDIAFGGNRIQIFYDGHSYVTIPETLTATTDDPMWITLGTGSCDATGVNECKNGTLGIGVAGNIQIKYLRAFVPPK